MKKFLFAILFIFIFLFSSSAQEGEIGIFGGTSFYMGEINKSKLFFMPSFAVGGTYRHIFNDRWAFRLDGTYTKLRGDDAKSKNTYQLIRNQNFSTKIGDISLLLELNFFSFDKSEFDEKYFTPYVYTGISFLIIPEPEYPFEFGIPIGFGLKYALTRKITLGAEWTFRITHSDFIDKIYHDNFTSTNSIITKQHSYNPNKDIYSFVDINLYFQIFKAGKACPAYK